MAAWHAVHGKSIWIWRVTVIPQPTKSPWSSLMACGRTGAKTVTPRWSMPTTLYLGMKSTPPATPLGRWSLRCMLIPPRRWSRSKYTRPLARHPRHIPRFHQLLLVRCHLLRVLPRVSTFCGENRTRRRPKFSKLTRHVVAGSFSPAAMAPTPLFRRCTLRSKTPHHSLLASCFQPLPPFRRSPSLGPPPRPLCHLPLI